MRNHSVGQEFMSYMLNTNFKIHIRLVFLYFQSYKKQFFYFKTFFSCAGIFHRLLDLHSVLKIKFLAEKRVIFSLRSCRTQSRAQFILIKEDEICAVFFIKYIQHVRSSLEHISLKISIAFRRVILKSCFSFHTHPNPQLFSLFTFYTLIFVSIFQFISLQICLRNL